ncbi:MAG: prenyltransferase/squalene oxidase repeat-containing protein [Planctomycetota bacterium]
MKRLFTFAAACLLFAASTSGQEAAMPQGGGLGDSERKEAKLAIERALHWFEKQQNAEGAWEPAQIPAVTALVVTAFLGHGGEEFGESNPAVQKGIEFVLKFARDDGAISGEEYAGYNTSICMMMLLSTRNPKYKPIVERGRRFLIRLQCDEDDGCTPDKPEYGGIGYDGHGKPCLSNLEMALEAIKHSEADLTDSPNPPNRLHWDRAIAFLQRCQNFKNTNDQPWAENDGGFIYAPGESKAGGTRSYGSMTYAGLKSFIYADVKRDDPRVQAAAAWIRDNYTLDCNPNMGDQGLYYAYHTFAKAMHVFGQEVLVDAKGATHAWRKDLTARLLSLQKGDGFWVNENGRWMESNPVLVTAYACIALELACSGAGR